MYYLEAQAVAPTIPAWTTILIAIGTFLGGGGGIAAAMKVHYDRKQGIDSQEVVEDDAIVARWKALSEAQVQMLLEPVKVRLTELEKEVSTLKLELDASRRKYWTAIPYIRTLISWINRHMPDGTQPLPPIPANIAEDV